MKMILTPAEIKSVFTEFTIKKTELPFLQLFILSTLGGIFIAFGGLLTLLVVGGSPEIVSQNPGIAKFIAGALFPVGLIFVSIAGADLFTSNCAGFTFAIIKNSSLFKRLTYLLIISYVGNFLGTQLIAYFMSNETGIMNTSNWKDYSIAVANSKMQLDYYTVFMRGIGANFLVCLGAWMGYASKDVVGKSVAIWFPIMLFVTLGYEHAIANMFFIPNAIYLGASISWSDFIIQNLIPSTLGNFVGGAVFLGLLYAWAYPQKKVLN